MILAALLMYCLRIVVIVVTSLHHLKEMTNYSYLIAGAAVFAYTVGTIALLLRLKGARWYTIIVFAIDCTRMAKASIIFFRGGQITSAALAVLFVIILGAIMFYFYRDVRIVRSRSDERQLPPG